MAIDPQEALAQGLIQFSGNLPTFIAVVLAWMNSNARISDTNLRISDFRSDLKELKDEIREEFKEVKDTMKELRAEMIRENLVTRELLRSELRRVEEGTRCPPPTP
jgi:flagellar biosynthesis protein FlhB